MATSNTPGGICFCMRLMKSSPKISTFSNVEKRKYAELWQRNFCNVRINFGLSAISGHTCSSASISAICVFTDSVSCFLRLYSHA